MTTRSFTPSLFRFLRDLEANNDRAWFAANKDRYELHVKEPGLQFIADVAPHLARVSRHVVADPRPVGGSLFRIYRDTRFSSDKTPYKIHSGMQFRHESAKDAHAPGFYLHLQPGDCYMGVGLWRPDTATARTIREAIAADPAGWRRAAYGKRFREVFDPGDGEPLKRPPAGFDPDHRYIDDIKRRSFTAGARLTQKRVTAPGFVEDFAGMCRVATPFMRFLCKAVGVPF